MAWSKEDIRKAFTPANYYRGEEYYKGGHVSNLKVAKTGNLTEIAADVSGTRATPYRVRVMDSGKSAHISCTCPQFDNQHQCKHIVATMLKYADEGDEAGHKTDAQAIAMLQKYRNAVSAPVAPPRKAVLQPLIRPATDGAYPSFSFRVGYADQKLYVIKSIPDFLDRVIYSEDYQYGQLLTLNHSIDGFDEKSRKLIHLLMEQYPEYRSTRGGSQAPRYNSPSYSYGYSYRSRYPSRWSSLPSYEKNFIMLTGDSFNEFFDLMRGESLHAHGSTRDVYTFEDGRPEVSLSVQKQEGGASIAIDADGAWKFFGNMEDLYALGNDKVLRCPPDFERTVYPLLASQKNSIFVAAPDLPEFMGYVVPAIQSMVEIMDPESILDEYVPAEGTPLFYFDIEGDVLNMRLGHRYGDEEIDPLLPASKTPEINRDLRSEREAQRQAERWMQFAQTAEGPRYLLEGDDAIFDFLTMDLGIFDELGEVFVSDRLRAKRIQPNKAAVGVSVADGILNLDIDTGEFPPEELEALYSSLLRKKKYHRLKDGRFLELDGSSSVEKIAEMAHMLRLKAGDLQDGKAELPAFRALYVDDVLGGSENIEVKRDKQFRSLVRNFKTVRDSDYQLPQQMEGVLRSYQKTGFQWLKTLEEYGFGGILADEMGLGKTAQLIAYLSTATRADKGKPSLVVCPASLILNWGDELQKFAPSLKAALVMGTVAERKKIMAKAEACEVDVVITSYELLRQDIERYKDLQFYTFILDEAQHVKNPDTLVSKAVKRINCERRFVMTGTPIENRLSEMWNLFDFLMPGYLYSHGIFVEKLEKPIIQSENKEASEQLRRLVRPFMLRRLKKDVLKELPPKIDYIRRVPLTAGERKVYLAEAHKAKEMLLDGQKASKFTVLAELTRLREICCAPQLVFENYKGADSKLDACMDLVEGMVANGHQILLFSQFTSMLDIVRERLKKAKISNFTLQGSTPKKKRAQLVKEFNEGGASVFLISLKAGGTGLNLTAADVVIHYDPWWNQAAQDQATDRAHRIGQKSNVQVYKLIAEDTIEEKIQKLQEKKAGLLDMVSEEGDGILSMSQDEMLALFD